MKRFCQQLSVIPTKAGIQEVTQQSGYRLPVQARDRLRRYDIKLFLEIESLILVNQWPKGKVNPQLKT
jgi:hypothetical protein